MIEKLVGKEVKIYLSSNSGIGSGAGVGQTLANGVIEINGTLFSMEGDFWCITYAKVKMIKPSIAAWAHITADGTIDQFEMDVMFVNKQNIIFIGA